MELQARPAGLLRILGAAVYDLIVLLGLFMLVSYITLLVYNKVTGEEFINSDQGFLTVILLLTAFVYYGFSWKRAGQTIGMKSWKIYLVDSEKEQLTGPDWFGIVIRFISSGLSAACFMIGFLMIPFHPKKRSAHDLFSKTHIVHIPNAKKDW